MSANVVRTNELWNRPGRLGRLRSGKTKTNEDFLLRDPENPLVPGTPVRRIAVTYLGPKTPVVDEAEVERLIRELGEFYAKHVGGAVPHPAAAKHATAGVRRWT